MADLPRRTDLVHQPAAVLLVYREIRADDLQRRPPSAVGNRSVDDSCRALPQDLPQLVDADTSRPRRHDPLGLSRTLPAEREGSGREVEPYEHSQKAVGLSETEREERQSEWIL